ncbi:DUF3369 domain-containing protein [Psychrosphaera sp. 1_MG-2023]|uniref:DUF3369 domain-containing protein n=2 Tax=Psychrosphaera TaxID=907197 RepID=UPI0026E3229E|nr:DUF3369 domain-containing protein [Psychrosphaera sp. 1_MG-2023]MDO6718203.1 DUF3369 domain-containing protein [Psychrosphaera sp. 1_MG-2023]
MNDFLFADETINDDEASNKRPWKVLIVDDEPDIHNVTKLVLMGFELDGQGLELLHAYSAAEAEKIILEQSDIAVGFIDVVMETNDAGLKLIKFIRDVVNNHTMRLVLRTGQPGEAPEDTVIKDYDINDYKNKTELTASKMKTLMFATLRSYRDIQTIEHHKLGLERIISATINFLDCSSLTEFASAVLDQVANVMGLNHSKIMCCAALNNPKKAVDFRLLALSGVQSRATIHDETPMPPGIRALLEKAHATQSSIREKDHFVGYFVNNSGLENLLYVSHDHDLTDTDHNILEFFTNNIAVAYDNIRMREVVEHSQKELSYILGEAVEKRSKETGSHVKRVANFSYMLAIYYGLPAKQAEQLKMASPLHDVGKIGIPDSILNKPAKLDPEEWAIMQTHAQLGFDILTQSQNEILQLGAIIAQQHHERWDGKGYPAGLAKENIEIAGRITAIADVFDALASERCYKPAWPLDKVLNLLKEERGKQFEPKLVDILLEHVDEFIAIRDAFPDSMEE